MKTVIAVGVLLLFTLPAAAQKSAVVDTSLAVSGNCGHCKSRIEKAVKISGVKHARWDRKSKTLRVAFLSPPLSADSLQRIIAAAGHDTEQYRAPDSVYSELPGCCLYRDSDDSH